MPFPRRRILQLAAAGAFGAAGVPGLIREALAQGRGVQGVNTASGELLVNGKPAARGTPVTPGDVVSTAKGANATVVVGDDAFMIRGGSRVAFAGKAKIAQVTVESGGVLSVFGRTTLEIKARNATVGIRGTGAYVEFMDDRVYFCLCYGEALLSGPGFPGRTIKTKQHEEPLLLSDRGGVLTAAPGPFVNHSDDELILLEALVGRRVPFGKPYPRGG